MSDFPEHVRRNRELWDDWARTYAAPGEAGWAQETPTWGIWGVPESEVGLLPADLAGVDAIELGCGTAYISAWLARRGARVVGIDNSQVQLSNARRFQREFGLDFPLIHADAERVPLADESFDLAISEYGACLWCDPYRWIPEAARLLRPGGRLIFLKEGFFERVMGQLGFHRHSQVQLHGRRRGLVPPPAAGGSGATAAAAEDPRGGESPSAAPRPAAARTLPGVARSPPR